MADRQLALTALLAVISQHLENGERTPCVNRERGHLWLSDKRADQEAATHACLTACPAFAACEAYVTAHPEPAGVWAGTVQTSPTLTRPRKAQP